MASAAGAMLDSMCGRFVADERVLLRTAHHFHSGTMLVEAACGGLPRPSCLQVLAGSCMEWRHGRGTWLSRLPSPVHHAAAGP